MMECERCGLEKRMEIAEKDILTLQLGLKNQDTQVAVFGTKLDNLIVIVAEVRAKLNDLTEQPAKRWDTVVNTAIIVVVSAIVGAALGRLL